MGCKVAENAISGRNVKHFNTIKTFFSFATAEQHSTTLGKWRSLLLEPGWERLFSEPADLVFRYQHFISLYEAAFGILTDSTTEAFIDEDILETFRSVFVNQDIGAYKAQLFDWLTDVLSNTSLAEGDAQIEPLYTNTGKLISAGWRLLQMQHHVALTANSPSLTDKLISLAAFIVPVACSLLDEADAQSQIEGYNVRYPGQQQLLEETRNILKQATDNFISLSRPMFSSLQEKTMPAPVAANDDWF